MRWRCQRYRRTSSGSGQGMEKAAICGALIPAAAKRDGAYLGLERLHRGEGETPAAPPHLLPRMLSLKSKGSRHGEEGGRIGRPAPAEPALERVRPGPRPVPGDDRPANPALRLGRRPHEPAAARRAHPLVQVAGVDIASDRGEVEVDLPWAVRPVDDRECAVLAGERAQPRDRQDEGAQRRDVADEQHTRAPREPRRDRVEELVRALRRPGQRGDDDLRAREGRDFVPQDPLGAVLVVGEQNLVAASQIDAPRDRIESRRHVRNKPDVVGRSRSHVAERPCAGLAPGGRGACGRETAPVRARARA